MVRILEATPLHRGQMPDMETPWFAREWSGAVAAFGSDPQTGLTGMEAADRLARLGPNEIARGQAPSAWGVASSQLWNPMNLMLVAVAVVSLLISQFSTAVIVGFLVLVNVVLGVRHELKARERVDALARMQVPQTKVVRDGHVTLIPATALVPGDIVRLEAGDIVPADGRIMWAAAFETEESALTGESAPVAKHRNVLPSDDVALGDRTNMVFQNTTVTGGAAVAVVTATGMQTEMGRIASLLSTVARRRPPLQAELDSLTQVLALVAWSAVAFVFVAGLIRGMPGRQLLLLGTAMAIAALPSGLPAFVSGLLSMGAKRLADDAKAIVKDLADVETLGATSAITSDKTGTLTMNQMMVSDIYAGGSWFHVEGEGYGKSGAVQAVAGAPTSDFARLALGLCLDSEATVGRDGTVVGDPTDAALTVLAAKLGVDAEETRRVYPRVAEVPFDAEYRFMATFHEITVGPRTSTIQLVKGAPDAVLARCSKAGGSLSGSEHEIEQAWAGIAAAHRRMRDQGLRVLAFAARLVSEHELQTMRTDPMALAQDLSFVALTGIIDPPRKEAKVAVQTALDAGIEVRMATGDHALTARAIGKSAGLGPGAIGGTDLQALSDVIVTERLPRLHVFGRVCTEDKLRLARLVQESGEIVAMTGAAASDAPALRQADVGVAMGSGSEVAKQAARVILTEDDFGALVRAIAIGRRAYDKIVSYVRFQMTQLLAMVALFVVASLFNIDAGVALTPSMVLYLFFFVTAIGVVVIAADPGDPDVMHRPPRDPTQPIASRSEVKTWLSYSAVLFVAALIPLVVGPDTALPDKPSASLTMTFVVFGLGTVFQAITNRREPGSGLTPPLLKAIAILSFPVLMLLLATELPALQSGLTTQPLSGRQWLASVGLALLSPLFMEGSKWYRRRHPSEHRSLEGGEDDDGPREGETRTSFMTLASVSLTSLREKSATNLSSLRAKSRPGLASLREKSVKGLSSLRAKMGSWRKP